MKVGFIGLGHMGMPMARNLKEAGVALVVYNRTPEKARALEVPVAENPAALARQVEVLITMLSDDTALRQVLFQEGVLEALKPGAIHLSMSTVSVAVAQELTRKHQEAGHTFISAPVFGRPEAAANKALLVVAAGPKEQVEAVQPLFQSLGRAHHHVGEEPWQANLFKIAGNFWISSMIETMGESFALLRKAKTDHHHFFTIMMNLFQSPIYESYGKRMLEEKKQAVGFPLIHGLKDVQLVMEAARDFFVPMPFASVLKDNCTSAVNHGKENIDWSSALVRQIAENAGIS